MKKLENKVMDPAAENRPAVTYADLCRTSINNVPKEGFTVEEMRKRLKIMDALDKAKDCEEIVLEDADLAILQQCVKELRWIRLDKGLVEFVEAVAAVK